MTIDVLPSGLAHAGISQPADDILNFGSEFSLNSTDRSPFTSMYDILGSKIQEEARARRLPQPLVGSVGVHGFMIAENAATLFARDELGTYLMQTGVFIDEEGRHNLHGEPIPVRSDQMASVVTHLAAICRIDFNGTN